MKQKRKQIALGIALLYWLLTFYTDTKLFTLSELPTSCLPMDQAMTGFYHILTKVCLLIFLAVLALYVSHALTKRRRFIAFFALLLIYGVGLLLTYPGYYMNDDAILFAYATRYYPVYWHNYLTSLFYMVGMSFFPASCGPVLLSDVCYAMVYAYLFDRGCDMACKEHSAKKWSWLYFLPAVLPFTLLGALMCFRPAIYSGFFVFYFGYLYLEWKEEKTLTIPKLIALSFLTAILAFWRSESIVLFPFGVILIALTYYKKMIWTKNCLKSGAVFLLLAGIFLLVVKVPQNIGEEKYYGSDYLIISTTRPLSVILHRQQEYEGAFEDFQNLDRVTGLDYLMSDTLSCSAYNRYNSDHNNGSFTQTMASKIAQKAYIKSAIRLISKNLDLYLGERLQLFLVTNGIFNYDPKIVGGVTMTFNGGYPQYEHDRDYSLGMLEQYKRIPLQAGDGYVMALFRYGGEAYLPMLALAVVAFFVSLIRRKGFHFFVFAALLAREAAVFLMAPTSFIQYSYPMMYVTAWYLLFGLAHVLTNWKKHENHS